MTAITISASLLTVPCPSSSLSAFYSLEPGDRLAIHDRPLELHREVTRICLYHTPSRSEPLSWPCGSSYQTIIASAHISVYLR
jgi:hypothetical protein